MVQPHLRAVIRESGICSELRVSRNFSLLDSN